MNQSTHHEQLSQMLTGHWTTQALYTAAKLGIADLIHQGVTMIDELAVESSADADSLYRLLRALASRGVFQERADREFGLTPIAEFLRSDVEGSLRAMALMLGEEQYVAWGELLYSVQTGKTSFDKVYGAPIFDYLAERPDKAQIFDEAMTAIHGRETGAILDGYDFSGIAALADVGGGNGSNLTAILQRYTMMKGILYDLPHVVERAESRIAAASLQDRCQLIGGDFFQSVPSGADVYLLRHVIHDWDDEKSLRILRHCHSAMPANGRLLLVETVIPPGNARFAGKLLDLTMLLIPGGKERTEQEYQRLYEDAGFELVRIVPTATEMSLIEGRPK